MIFAPCFLQPQAFHRRCRPVHCGGQPRCESFGPSAFFMLLAFMLTFPCLLRCAFSVLAFGIFVSTVASAASWLGEFFGGCLSSDEPTTKPSSCKKTADPSCKKPDHSSVSITGNESSLTIVVSAPGVPTDNLQVKLQPGEPPVLTIKGESTV